jgi:hypothetical protein
MKDGYLLWGAILLVYAGRLIYLYYQKRKQKQTDVEIADFRWDIYLNLREQTFSINPVTLGIEFPEDTETAFGIAIEMHLGDQVRFVIVLKNNEIWAFNTRFERKNIFNAPDEKATEAVMSAFTTAQYNFARMRRKFTSVPELGFIKFHILTNKDIYSSSSLIQDLSSENFLWQELVDKVDEAIKTFDKQG